MSKDIYDPAFVADLFDRCSGPYRKWSFVASFGMIWAWRKACVRALPAATSPKGRAVDLMAGTGEVWPHLLKRFAELENITAIDISKGMHAQAMARLHSDKSNRIDHLCANALTTDLPEAMADVVVSTFGLKTFNPEQQMQLAKQTARLLKAGGAFSFIEAGDPLGWRLRPLYRLYMTRVLPLVERLFLNGAQDFTMIGIYTAQFVDISHFADCLKAQGLEVTRTKYVFGCASGVSGHKPTP